MRSPGASTKGRLLVATPPLDDPNFDRTVVYILEHGPPGAVGVVINRRDVELGRWLDGLEAWRNLLAPPREVFHGGPVEADALIAVATGDGRLDDAWGQVDTEIGTVDLTRAPDEVAERVHRVRVFRGYAGWAPGQLEAEIDQGAWMVFDADESDIFTSTPEHLWREVVRRQGGRLVWIADAPDDLSAN